MKFSLIYFFATVVVLFLGFGCSPIERTKTIDSIPVNTAGVNNITTESVDNAGSLVPVVEEKKWRLSFDLPEGWVMAVYGSPRSENLSTPNFNVEKDAKNIYLQNTTKFPLFGGIKPDDYSLEKYQAKNIVRIKVSVLSSSEIIPPIDSFKNEDLGNGFYKVTNCDITTNPECEIYGQSSYEYYFLASSGNKYRFSFDNQGVDKSIIEAVILSGKE